MSSVYRENIPACCVLPKLKHSLMEDGGRASKTPKPNGANEMYRSPGFYKSGSHWEKERLSVQEAPRAFVGLWPP